MSQNYKNALELKTSIPTELLSVYEIETASILEDIKENGIMTPITLSKDNVALDGYRCLFAAIELGNPRSGFGFIIPNGPIYLSKFSNILSNIR